MSAGFGEVCGTASISSEGKAGEGEGSALHHTSAHSRLHLSPVEREASEVAEGAIFIGGPMRLREVSSFGVQVTGCDRVGEGHRTL